MRSCFRLAAVLLGTFALGQSLLACGPTQNPFADGDSSLMIGGSTAVGGSATAGAMPNGTAGSGASTSGGAGTAGAPFSDAGSSSGGAAGSVSSPSPPSGGMAAGGSDAAAGGASPGAVVDASSSCYGKLRVPEPVLSDCELSGVKGWFGYVNDTKVVPVVLHPGANGSQTAAEFQGQNANQSGMGISLFCDDVTRYSGISFWAKGNGGEHLRFLAAVPGSDATIGRGDCVPTQMTCNDHPGKAFELAAGWHQYTVLWSELKQYGWGSPAAFDGVINTVLWINDGPVGEFDFAIDEVRLIE